MIQSMPDAATIVLADETHVDGAWTVVDRCRAALWERGIFQWDEIYPTRDTVAADCAHKRLYVLTVSGECKATVALDDQQDDAYRSVRWTTSEPALVVHRLCVDPTAQGLGYGRQLMEFVETHAARSGYSSIRLDAYMENGAAVALYRRRGYREVGQVLFPRRSGQFVLFERAVAAPRPDDAR